MMLFSVSVLISMTDLPQIIKRAYSILLLYARFFLLLIAIYDSEDNLLDRDYQNLRVLTAEMKKYPYLKQALEACIAFLN